MERFALLKTPPGNRICDREKEIPTFPARHCERPAALVWRNGRPWRFSEPKTPKSRRSIPIAPSLTRGLSEHKRQQAEERLKAGPEYHNLDLVFATKAGGPLTKSREQH